MSKFNFGTTEKCTKCSKSVYPDDRIVIESKILHHSCFRCAKCNNKLQNGKFAALEGTFFCKPHFKEAFSLKGRYDFAQNGNFTQQSPVGLESEAASVEQLPTEPAPSIENPEEN